MKPSQLNVNQDPSDFVTGKKTSLTHIIKNKNPVLCSKLSLYDFINMMKTITFIGFYFQEKEKF